MKRSNWIAETISQQLEANLVILAVFIRFIQNEMKQCCKACLQEVLQVLSAIISFAPKPFGGISSAPNERHSNIIYLTMRTKMGHLLHFKDILALNRLSSLCTIIVSRGCANLGARFLSCPGALLFAFVILSFTICPEVWAITDGDFNEEITKGESFITGGYMRLGLLAGCGIAGIIAMFKQSVMGLVIAASGALFIFLMKGWIGANFTAII